MAHRRSASLERAIQDSRSRAASRKRTPQDPHVRAIEISVGSPDIEAMRMLLAPAIAAAALAAAPPTLTHGQLVARADGICVRYAALLESPPGVEGRLGDADYDAAWLRLFARQRTEL